MKRLFSIIALIALSAFLTYAQESTGEIAGKVTLAEDGTPVPGVAVTLTGETYGKSSAVTSSEGSYRFVKLSPGNYALRFELQGFKAVERTGIRVNIGLRTTLDVGMEPGAIEEQVTVIGQTPLIDTRKSQIVSSYTNEMITSLPIALRTSEIINLAPGVMSALPQIAGQGSGTLHGFGVQNFRGEYYLDGGSFRSTYGHGDMPTGVSVDRVEEVQVTTSGQDIANVQGGPTINFVSKRGGNRLSGDAFISLLDKTLEATSKGFPKFMSTPSTTLYRTADPTFGNVYGLGMKQNAGILRTYDYGVSLGGPIFTDHLWFFGSWAVTDSWNQSYMAVPADRYYTPDMYGKLNFQWKTVTVEVSYNHRDSVANNVPFSTTITGPNNVDRTNPADVYTAQAAVTLWQKLLVSGKMTYFSKGGIQGQTGFTGTGTGTAYADGWTYSPPKRYYTYNFFKNPPYNTEASGFWQRYGNTEKRPYLVLEGDYFAEKFLGGDHEIKFGVDRNFARLVEEYEAPNQSFVRDYPATATQLAPTYSNGSSYWGWFQTYRDRFGEKRATRTGVYIQDTMTYGRFSVNAGARVDWHAWEWLPSTYHAIAPADEEIGGGQWSQWVGEMPVQGGSQKMGATFSPRISVVWDIFGKGKDLIKLAYANYAGAVDTLQFRTGFKSGYWAGEFIMPFIDYNMDFIPEWPTAKFPTDRNEFFLNDKLGHWPTPDDFLMMTAKGIAEQATWNAAHPGVATPWDYYTYPGWFYLSFSGNRLGNKSTGTAPLDKLSDSFKPDRVLELTVGYEKQLSTDISVQVMGAYKREYNFAFWRGYKGTIDNPQLMPIDTMKSLGKDSTTGWEVFVGDPSFGTPVGYIGYTYGTQYYNYFKGLEFIFNKRFSHSWMLQASLDLEDWRVHYAARAVDDPKGLFARSTLYDYYNNGYAGVGEYFSTEPKQNSRWHFKISGLVRLPFSLNFSGFIDAREGYLTDRWLASNSGQYLPAFGSKYGDNRLPNFWYANFTLDRTFKFSDQVYAKVFATAYNAFNVIKTTAINSTVVPTRWPAEDFPTDVNRPRIVQFGVRFSFK